MPSTRNKHKAQERANVYVLPPEKLKQRETVFAIYRDMGRTRSLVALERELKRSHPTIAVSRPTLEKWSKQHQWYERVKAHDAAVVSEARVTAPVPSPEFDQVQTLLSAAHLALSKALSGTPVVTKASDMKALIDASANALKLADAIRAKQGDSASREQIIREMERVLSEVEQRRRRDAVDTMRAFGIPAAAMRKMGLTAGDGVVDDEVVSDCEVKPDVCVEEEPERTEMPQPVEEPAMVAPPQPDSQPLPRFANVINALRSRADADDIFPDSDDCENC
jgi:hypothetical protein